MRDNYSGLNDLVNNDETAKKYFANLPEYIRDQLNERRDSINSMESLKNYVDNITRMDD